MSHDNVDDLVALARRGLLSEPETRRLRMALQTSEGARALHEVGLSFDASATTLPGDGELLRRVAHRVASRRSTPSAPVGTPRRQRFIFMALALLVAGAAAASVASLVLDRDPHAGDSNAIASPPADGARTDETPTADVPPTAATSQGSALGDSSAAVEIAQLDPTDPDPTDPDLTGAAPAAPPSDRTRATGEPPEAAQALAVSATGAEPTSIARAPSEKPSAAALFKTANTARKAGNAASALDGYRRLQRSFPASSEARVSRVLAGRLLLGAGRASSALAQFDGYLSGGGQGGLAEEALWGKAQALARLGRASEERAVWRTLLQKFPKSVYAATARQRLER